MKKLTYFYCSKNLNFDDMPYFKKGGIYLCIKCNNLVYENYYFCYILDEMQNRLVNGYQYGTGHLMKDDIFKKHFKDLRKFKLDRILCKN